MPTNENETRIVMLDGPPPSRHRRPPNPSVRYCTDPIGVCGIPAVVPQVIADAGVRAMRRLGIVGGVMTYGINVAGPVPRARFEIGAHALEATTIAGLVQMLDLLDGVRR